MRRALLAAAGVRAAGAACNLSGTWFGAGSDDPITITTQAPPAWSATLAGVWRDQPGTFDAATNALSFSCCGGIVGTIDAACAAISWRDAHADAWARGGAARAAAVSSPLLSAGVNVSASGAASLGTFSFFGAGANTTNFALPSSGGAARGGGGTLLVPAGLAGSGAGAVSATCGPGCALAAAPARVVLSNLTIGPPGGAPLATETWTLVLLNESAFSYTVDRVWTGGGGDVGVDRFGFSFETTGGLPIHAQQIPGFVDRAMFMNATTTGGFDIGNGAFEFLAPAAREFVRFTPTGAVFIVEGAAELDGVPSPVFFSFAKPFADGTAWCDVGFETIDPRAGARRALAAGATQRLSLTFHLVETDVPAAGGGVGGFPALAVTLPDAALTARMSELFSSQYQLMGWIVGNNPASVPCLHEMAWWPLMASTLNAGSVAFAAMQQELSFFAGCGWARDVPDRGAYEFEHSCDLADGARFGFTHRYASSGFYNAPWGPLQDEDVMFPIAVYFAATSSGDVAWLASLRPALDAVAAYLAAHGLNNSASPVVFTSPASGLADGGKHASNWYDIVLFGHFDAYLAVHGVWALGCLAEIYTALGDAPAAAGMAALRERAAADFNGVFWNASARAYTDWIDTSGRARSYFYTDIAFVAIIAGVADAAQAAALLDHYDERLADIYIEYNVTAGNVWSAPSNLYPITDACEFANSGPGECPRGGVPFPGYENGGAFFHTPGLQFAALGAAGRADAAYAGFVALLGSGFGDIRGWAQQLYWGTNGEPDKLVGGDPLNTAALAVWGFLRAAFGVAPTLTRGLRVVNVPAAAAEGAVWNTSYLGASVCLKVDGGRARFCNGTIVG